MFVNHFTKVFQHRKDGDGNHLAESADRRQLQGMRELIEQWQVGARGAAFGPSRKHFDQLLRTHSARDALATRFVAIEADRVERHVEHASAFGADHDGSRADHGTGCRYCVPVESEVSHGCGQVPRGRARWRVREQLAISENTAGIFEDELRILRAHGDFVDSGTIYIAANAYELHTRCGVCSLGLEPVRATGKDHGGEGESLDVVDGCRLIPEAIRAREGWLVARFGAFTFDGFEQRALFAADVTSRAHKDFEVEG